MRKIVLWSPRILGIGVALFLALFALDAFGPERSMRDSILAFFVHVAPSLLLLAAVAASWRWQWVGAVAFIAAGSYYAIAVWPRAEWILVITGPLLVVGLLFAWSWILRRRIGEPRADS